jgi:hypothetical protein
MNRLNLPQEVIEKLQEGRFDENMLESAEARSLDGDIMLEDEADDSIMGDMSFHESLDSIVIDE